MSEVEFPFVYTGVTLDQDDGGLWVTVNGDDPYWIGPRALAALRAAGVVVAEEPEWEYGYDSIADAEAERPTTRRRKAGPWVPVKQEEGTDRERGVS